MDKESINKRTNKLANNMATRIIFVFYISMNIRSSQIKKNDMKLYSYKMSFHDKLIENKYNTEILNFQK